MKETTKPCAEHRLTIGLLVLILCAAIGNAVLMMKLTGQTTVASTAVEQRPVLPCGAVPASLIHEEPACVNKLLQWMNVTNVRILEANASLPGMDEAMEARLRRLGWNRSRSRGTADDSRGDQP